MIAEKVVELRNGVRKVGFADPVHHVDILSGVQMVQSQMVLTVSAAIRLGISCARDTG
jgi:hypothetical protein